MTGICQNEIDPIGLTTAALIGTGYKMLITPVSSGPDEFLLLETGDFLLLETGDQLILD